MGASDVGVLVVITVCNVVADIEGVDEVLPELLLEDVCADGVAICKSTTESKLARTKIKTYS